MNLILYVVLKAVLVCISQQSNKKKKLYSKKYMYKIIKSKADIKMKADNQSISKISILRPEKDDAHISNYIVCELENI